MKRRTIFYKDEINDDFAGVTRNTLLIDGKYKYVKKSFVWKTCSWFFYNIIMKPFAYLYMKIKFAHKVVGGEKLRKNKKGCFVYGNHVLLDGDAFIPNIVDVLKTTYIVVHPDNISVKLTRWFIEMNGAIPIPTTVDAGKNFLKTLEEYVEKNCIIQIYPEAHVWPYYTKIRPFVATSFKYPIMFKTPIFVLTNTFRKRKFFKIPKVVTYVDGPFFVDESLPQKVQVQKLRDKVYMIMSERVKTNNYQYIKYIKEK